MIQKYVKTLHTMNGIICTVFSVSLLVAWGAVLNGTVSPARSWLTAGLISIAVFAVSTTYTHLLRTKPKGRQ